MRKLVFITFTIALVAITFPIELYAQQVGFSWDYPIKPGTVEWKNLKNSDEKIEACQIPVEILSVIPTEQLIDLCIAYPLVLDITAFNNVLTGFEKYEKDFNGFQELTRRMDAALILKKKYTDIDPLELNMDWSNFKNGNHAIKISIMEILLSHKNLLSKLDNEEKKELANQYVVKREKKESMEEFYKDFGIQTTYLANYKLLEFESSKPEDIKAIEGLLPYVTSGILTDSSSKEKIKIATQEYLSK